MWRLGQGTVTLGNASNLNSAARVLEMSIILFERIISWRNCDAVKAVYYVFCFEKKFEMYFKSQVILTHIRHWRQLDRFYLQKMLFWHR